MSGPWYAAALPPRSDAAWELYHENSKRGPGDAPSTRHGARPSFGHTHLPVLVPGDAGATRPATLTAEALLRLIAAGGRPLDDDDPVQAFVGIVAVSGLPQVLAVHDPAGPCLRLFRDDVQPEDLVAVLDGGVAGAAAIVLLAADLEAATAAAGERGYRNALIAVGRRVAAFEAAAPEGVTVRMCGFRDRAADDLLYLDGLARSVLAVVTIGVGADRGGAP